ncbi:MAG: hypothetical protein M3Y53_08000 [Thermoproteota archaeon]|nr:hypothetical protein [Thermoproteota archaeon]
MVIVEASSLVIDVSDDTKKILNDKVQISDVRVAYEAHPIVSAPQPSIM